MLGEVVQVCSYICF